jgi:hypothetical protein
MSSDISFKVSSPPPDKRGEEVQLPPFLKVNRDRVKLLDPPLPPRRKGTLSWSAFIGLSAALAAGGLILGDRWGAPVPITIIPHQGNVGGVSATPSRETGLPRVSQPSPEVYQD